MRPVNKYSFLLRWALKGVMFIFIRWFGIKPEINSDVKNLKGPFLLLSNHIGLFDPFLIGYFLKEPVQFVSSDAVFHNPFMRWFLNHLGVIKKKKNIRDTQMVRDLVTVIKRGNAVGIFPEGTRSWTGQTLPIDASIGKLAKLLDIPVVCVQLKGMQLFNPRWFPKVRSTRVKVAYHLSFSSEQLRQLDSNEITQQLRSDLFHDEVTYQEQHQNRIRSNRRAEFINHVIFLCPNCQAIGQFYAQNNHFGCKTCGKEHFVNTLSFFETIDQTQPAFVNIRDWFEWQKNQLEKLVSDHFLSKYDTPLFFDEDMIFYEEDGIDFKEVGVGRLSFFSTKIVFANDWTTRELLFTDIQTISPQLKERIELFYLGKALRIVGVKRGVSGVKWEIATNAIWRLTQQEHKISTYFNKT